MRNSWSNWSKLYGNVLVVSITWSIRLVCSGLIKTRHLRPSISTSGIEYLKLISNRLF